MMSPPSQDDNPDSPRRSLHTLSIRLNHPVTTNAPHGDPELTKNTTLQLPCRGLPETAKGVDVPEGLHWEAKLRCLG